MKHNTFLRKLPMIIGALTIILFALMAAKCPSSDKDDDKKAAKLSFAEKDIPGTSATLKVDFKKDGGVTKDGKKGKEHYYVIPSPDGTKPFPMPAVAAKSKGAITYKLKKFGLDDKKIKLTDASKEDGTVDNEGKVVMKSGKNGFYYLEASIAAKGDYKAASAKALLFIGVVPVIADYIVIDKLERPSSTTEAMVVLNEKKTEVIVEENEAGATDKKFSLIAKIDYSKFPSEAPLSNITLSILPVSGCVVDNAVPAAGNNKITLDINSSETAVKLKAALAAPYSTTAIGFADIKSKP